MSIKYLTYAFDARVNNPLRKLVLLKLCDNANDDGECWPSFQHIANQCEISRRSAISHIKALVDIGFLSVEARFKSGEQTSNMYKINKAVLLGSAGVALGGESPAPPLVQELHPPSAGAAPRTVIESSVGNVKENKTPAAKQLVTFSSWIKSVKESGEVPIPEDHPIFQYAEDAGLPIEYLRMCWVEFKARYTHEDKKYKDWRIVFGKAVRGNWFDLWRYGSDGYFLTTKGQQAMNAMNSRDKREDQ